MCKMVSNNVFVAQVSSMVVMRSSLTAANVDQLETLKLEEINAPTMIPSDGVKCRLNAFVPANRCRKAGGHERVGGKTPDE